MSYCTKCGNEVDKNDKFCGNCGYQLEQSKKVVGGLGKEGKKKNLIKAGLIIFSFLIILLIINSIVSNNLVDQTEEILSTNIGEMEREFDLIIDYSDLSVNAAFGEIVISDLVFEDGSDRLGIDKLVLSSTYSTLKEIIETEGEIDGIDKLYLNMKGINALSYSEPEFSIGELDLKFDGYLSEEMELNPDLVLDEDQHLSIKISEMDMGFAEMDELAQMGLPELAELSSITEISVDVRHDSNNKQVIFDALKFSNSFIDGNSSTTVNYSGSSFDTIELINYEIKANSQLLFEDLSFGDASQTGEYNIDKFLLEFESSGVYDDDPYSFVLPEGEISLALEGLDTEYTGEAEEMLGYILQFQMGLDLGGLWEPEIPELSIDNLNLNFKHADGQMVFYDTDLNSSLLDMALDFDIDFNELNPDHSSINEFKVRIADIHDVLNPIFDEIERDLGYFPRDEDEIVLEFEGTLGYFDMK